MKGLAERCEPRWDQFKCHVDWPFLPPSPHIFIWLICGESYICILIPQFGLPLCTEWSELSLSPALEGQGDPLCIGKQEVRTYSHLDGEYVDLWSAAISVSSWHQYLHW
jgi:hypothetical protein